MSIYKRIKDFLSNNFPLFVLYFVSFNSFEGIKAIENLLIFSFSLQMIIIYFYVLKHPESLGYGHIFFAGIIHDVVQGTILGATSLSYLILCFFTSYIRNVTLRFKMTTEWFAFIPALFFANLTFFIIINNFSNISFYYTELLRSSFFTFLFFPIFYYLFNLLQKRATLD